MIACGSLWVVVIEWPAVSARLERVAPDGSASRLEPNHSRSVNEPRPGAWQWAMRALEEHFVAAVEGQPGDHVVEIVFVDSSRPTQVPCRLRQRQHELCAVNASGGGFGLGSAFLDDDPAYGRQPTGAGNGFGAIVRARRGCRA